MASRVVFLVVISCLSFAHGISVEEYKRQCLFGHNKARAQHQDTPEMTWDDNLAAQAKRHALKLERDNYNSNSNRYIMYHSTDDVGENIFIGDYGQYSNNERKIADAVSAWYAEGTDYDYNRIIPYGRDLHFTQVVWKDSTKVGCATVSYSKNYKRTTIIVCQYRPTGNVSMGYIRNVKRLKAGGKSYLSPAELTAPAQGSCASVDTGPREACAGMKAECGRNDPLGEYLRTSCKKTCFC